MIKANELRIGNSVYFNGSHNEIGDISEIMKNDLNKVAPYKIGINHRIDIYYDSHKLKPIPLNEEWFLKFGFEKSDEKFDYFQRVKFYEYIIVAGFYNITFFISEYGHISSSKYTNIESVHQLQNLYFALTGSELTVA